MLSNSNKFLKLEETYSKAICDDAQSAEGYYKRAALFFSIRKFDAAISDISEAIRLEDKDDKMAKAFQLRGQAYGENGEFEKSIADFSEAIRFNPTWFEPFVSRGISYYFIKEDVKAVVDLDESLRLFETAEAYIYRGSALLRTRKSDEAINDFTAAIRLDPDNFFAHYMRGICFREDGHLEASVDDLSKAISCRPNDANAYYYRGVTHEFKGSYADAAADFSAAIRLASKQKDVYARRGCSAYQAGQDLDQAIADLSRSIRVAPDVAFAYFWRGAALIDKRDFSNAVKDLTESIRLHDDVSGSYFVRAIAYMALEKWGEAKADLFETLELSPAAFCAHMALASVFSLCPNAIHRDRSLAMTHGVRACEITQWRHPGCLLVLAAVYAENGDFNDAVLLTQKAVGVANDGRERAECEDQLRRHLERVPIQVSVDRTFSVPRMVNVLKSLT